MICWQSVEDWFAEIIEVGLANGSCSRGVRDGRTVEQKYRAKPVGRFSNS